MSAALEDPGMPDHLRSPAFRAAVWGWALAESAQERLLAWVEDLGADALMPRLPGTRPAFELWRAAASHAATMRSRLGLDPKSYAQIVNDVGLTQRRVGENLEKLRAGGAEIVARRRELAAGSGDGDASG